MSQRALEEIEKATGFKAVLLVGGLTPADNGAISTHMYVPFFFFFFFFFFTLEDLYMIVATRLGMPLALD